MTHKKRALALVVAALTVMTSAACGSSDSSGDSASDPIKIGAVFNLTGDGSVLGADEIRGAEAFVKQINADGGLLGRDVELVTIDAASDPQTAADAVARLTERDKVSVIIGPDGTPTTIAAIPAATRAQAPLVSTGGSWSYGMSGDDLKWAFTATPPTTAGLDAYEDYWASIGVKKVAIIGADTPFLDVPKGYFENKTDGVELTTLQSFSPGATDITAQMTTVLDSDPDFVLSWSTGPDGVTALKALDSLARDMPRGLNGGTTTTAFEEIAGDLLEGTTAWSFRSQIVDTLPAGPGKDAVQAYLDGMEAAGEDTVGGASNAIMAWDAMMSATDAIKSADSTEPSKVRDALETQSFEGAITAWKRTPDEHAGAQGGYVLVKYDDGQWHPIDEK
jgi:branched-chain amino acid transport system substrate-binding protein